MQYNDQRVYNAIVKRFIAVFYDDCKVSNTLIIGKAADVNFKTTGKEILSKGWRVVFESIDTSTALSVTNDNLLPTFVKGEKGPHQPSFLEKQTKPPNQFTEASLLRAMETAGKQVDDDELRDIMKENGIGRPSTRANIIETLFKRKYIKRNKKQLIPTITGIQLIDTIQNELLKSAELTGSWEKQLKDIEKGTFSAAAFINGMKRMVDALVYEVRSENVQNRISAVNNKPNLKTNSKSKSKGKSQSVVGSSCPKCKSGKLVKGKLAFGCNLYGKSCDFTLPFKFENKSVSENQLLRLLTKGSTVNLKGFIINGNTIDGLLRFDGNFKLKLEPKVKPKSATATTAENACPKCKNGRIIKGKTAYGCSSYKEGCTFRYTYANLRQKASGQTLTKALVYKILNS